MKAEKQQHNVLLMLALPKNRARQYASQLQNPKLYPLVVKYIGELREEWQKKYEVNL
jgi:hypothetical protein